MFKKNKQNLHFSGVREGTDYNLTKNNCSLPNLSVFKKLKKNYFHILKIIDFKFQAGKRYFKNKSKSIICLL